MFKNYFKAATIISVKGYREAMKAQEKLGFFFTNDAYIQSLSEKVDFNTLKDHVDKAIQILSPNEAKVVKLRFGLEDGKERNDEEIYKELGVAEKIARQIECQAFIKLLASPSREIRDFMSSYNTES